MIKIKDPVEVLKRLNSFSQGFGRIKTIEELANSVGAVLDDLLEIESSGLYMFDFQSKRLKLMVAKGFTEEERAEADRTAMERHPGFVFKTGKTLNIPDTANDPTNLSVSSKRSFAVRSRLYMPVFHGSQPVGAFGIVSSVPNHFSEEHQVVLSFICNIAGELYATIVNNTNQEKARKELLEITMRLETLIKNLRSGILVEDHDRKIALINQTFCCIFGIPGEPDHLLGADCSDSAEQTKGLFLDPDTFVTRIDKVLFEKTTVTGEVLELVDGRILERDYIPIFLDGKFLGNLWQYRDITAKVMIEEEMQQAMAAAHSANMAKSTFLANMSHEIRTPLNAVIGLSRLMRDTPLSPAQELLNDKLLLSGENLLGIISEILDFSKIEAGRIELENIPFNLSDLLDKVYRFISHAAEEKALSFWTSFDLPSQLAVVGDPVRLQQVLVNLLNNAIKFTSSGGVEVSCSLVSETGSSASFLFAVMDTGIGISEENLKSVFEKFQQEDESVTRVYGGTGLGLPISKQLVSLMGGNLQLESEKGRGSRFFFTLEFPTTDTTHLTEANRKIYIDPEALRGKKILVVEDNEFNQFIARSILLKWNMAVDIAANGKEAVEQVRQKPYDLILMDMQMPVMDGLTATRIIRNELNIRTPVIALTAFATSDAIDKTRDAGMNGYMTKPFEEETLFGELLSVFGFTPRYIADIPGHPDARTTDSHGLKLLYDLSRIAKLFDNDQAEIIDLIDKFIQSTPGYSSSLVTAYEQGNMEEVAWAAHKVKSSLELLATGNLSSTIRMIHEYATKGENNEKLARLMRSYRENIPVFIAQLTEKAEELKQG